MKIIGEEWLCASVDRGRTSSTGSKEIQFSLGLTPKKANSLG